MDDGDGQRAEYVNHKHLIDLSNCKRLGLHAWSLVRSDEFWELARSCLPARTDEVL